MKRSRGKQCAVIQWEKDGRHVTVPIRIVTEKDYHGTKTAKMTFVAACDDPQLHFEDTDIDQLREKVVKELDRLISIQWEMHVLVRIFSPRPNTGRYMPSASIGLRYEYVAIGTHTDGSIVHLFVPDSPGMEQGKWDGSRWSSTKPAPGLPTTGEVVDPWEGSQMHCLLKAMPENIVALNNFLKAIETLTEQMHKHFHPDLVGALLKKLVQPPTLLLEPGDQEK